MKKKKQQQQVKYGSSDNSDGNMALQAVTFPIMTIVKNHLIVNCVFVFIALFIVGLRLFARFMSGAKLWWDDYLILFSVPQGIGMLVIQGLCRLQFRRNGLDLR